MTPLLGVATSTVLIVVAAVVAVAALALVVWTRRGPRDGVESFRRQIDALSPEARRPVIDQVNDAARQHEEDGLDGT